MPKVLVPWSEAAEVGGGLPPGSYKLQIRSNKLGQDSSGNKRITFTFVVVDGKYKNRTVTEGFSFLPVPLGHLRRLWWAATGEELKADKVVDFDKLNGKVIVADSIESEGSNGKTYRNLRNFRPVEEESEGEEEEGLDKEEEEDENEEELVFE